MRGLGFSFGSSAWDLHQRLADVNYANTAKWTVPKTDILKDSEVMAIIACTSMCLLYALTYINLADPSYNPMR